MLKVLIKLIKVFVDILAKGCGVPNQLLEFVADLYTDSISQHAAHATLKKLTSLRLHLRWGVPEFMFAKTLKYVDFFQKPFLLFSCCVIGASCSRSLSAPALLY